MTAPTRNLFGTPATTGATNSDTLTCAMATMASGALAGRDKIVVECSSDGIQTQSVHASSGAGWNKIVQSSETASSAVNLSLYEFDVVTNDTVPDLVIDMGATTEMAVAHIFRVRASSGATLSRLGTATQNGSSTNPNPTAITNSSGASQDVLVIAGWGGDGNNVVSTAAPTNYGNHQSTGIANTAGTNIGTADRTITIANAGTEDPGAFTRATEQWATITVGYYETASGGGIAATAAITEADDTVAATATLAIAASLAKTEAGDTVSSASTLAIAASSAKTEAGDTLSATSAVAIVGSAAIVEAGDTLATTGAVAIAGSVGTTEGPDTLSATGAVAIVASASITEADDTLSAAAGGTPAIVGTLVITEAADTLSTAAALTLVGTGAIADAADSLNATATNTPTTVPTANIAYRNRRGRRNRFERDVIRAPRFR